MKSVLDLDVDTDARMYIKLIVGMATLATERAEASERWTTTLDSLDKALERS